jgi:translation initiation factor IF-2
MADVTVAQFAEVLKVPVDRLLQQLDQAGIKVDSAEDMITEDAKHELLTHLRRSHGRDDGHSRCGAAQDHPAAQIAVGAEAGEPPGPRAHRQRRGAQQAHLRQARGARGSGAPSARGIDRQRETEEQAKAALERAEHERLEKERLDRERLEEESRRRSDEENRKRTAEEEARRQAEVQAREQSRARAQGRGRGQARQGAREDAGRQGDPLRPPGAAHRRRCELAAQKEEVARRPPPLRWAAIPTPSTASKCRRRAWCAKSRSARP